MVDAAALVELIPGLLMTGKTEEFWGDIHTLLSQAKPAIAAGVLSDKSKAIPTLEAMARDGRYDAIVEAVYGLAKIGSVLIKNNPNDLAHLMAVARSLVPKPAATGEPSK